MRINFAVCLLEDIYSYLLHTANRRRSLSWSAFTIYILAMVVFVVLSSGGREVGEPNCGKRVEREPPGVWRLCPQWGPGAKYLVSGLGVFP